MSDSGNDGGSPDDSDSSPDIYRTHYEEGADESLSTAVVKAVAEFCDEPPTDPAPLYEAVDPELLNQLYDAIHRFPDSDGAGSTTFTYSGFEVTVFWNGGIEVQAEDRQ